MQKLNDNQSDNNQFSYNVKNPNKINVENKNNKNREDISKKYNWDIGEHSILKKNKK